MTRPDAYTVTEVNRYIARMFDTETFLNRIRILGEISKITIQSGSGHMYFTLKDDGAAIDAKMWQSVRKHLSFVPKSGDRVIVTGTVDVYEKSGRYSVTATRIEPAGEGDIYQKLLALKQELAEMGMFDPRYKLPIPKYAMRIGVVTAASGAVIHDISVNVKKRNPYAQIVLYPTLVQGEGAAEMIARGIQTLDAMDFDVIIIGRGGGSAEDLWAFNERMVADAIFASKTPIISAVGHEVDQSISNLVADLAVSTPTAAAQAATFSYEEFLTDLKEQADALDRQMVHALRFANNELLNQERAFFARSPKAKLLLYRQRFASVAEMFSHRMHTLLETQKQKLALCAARLDEVSPAKRMAGGYGFVVKADNRRLTSVTETSVGEELTLYVTDGSITAEVKEIKEK